MGIKKLFTFLDNNNLYKIYPFMNDLIRDLKLDKNKLLVGIDGNLFCYKYSHSCDNMLIGFFNQIIKFLSNGIYPIYIFDGGTLQEKEHTNLQRNYKKNINKHKLEQVEEEIKYNDDEILLIRKKKLEKNSIKISSTQINLVVELLDILNIPYIFSHGEGEYLAVLLNKYNIIDFFLSDDTDPIPAGIHRLIKFYANNVYYLDVNDIYSKLALDKDTFCDLCILLGSDYATFPHGLKPMELYELFKKFHNLNTVIDNLKINNQSVNDEMKAEIILLIEKIRNIYINSSFNEKELFINPTIQIKNYNIINSKNSNIYSNTMLEFWDQFINLISIDILNKSNSLNIDLLSNKLKFQIIQFVKSKKFNIKNIIKFLKNNIENITQEEISNISITFNYLNEFIHHVEY